MQRAPSKRLASEAFESHGDYQVKKDAKLAAQGAEAGARLRAERGDAGGASATLFAGVRLWVNGLTDPPAEDLKAILLLHGGEFFNTHSPAVTHIVTAQLSRAREEQLRRSRTAKVVTAAWVLESQRRGRLQDETRFNALAPDSAQHSISALLPGAHAGAAASPEQLAVRRGGPMSTLDVAPTVFLPGYRENSRLHHIGTWRNRIPTPLCAGPQPSVDPALERVVLHVDMDCFFVSVMICDRPELQGLPVVVSHGAASSTSSGEISSASYAALSLGIRKGMRMCDAHRLCPNVVVLPYEFDRFDAVSQQLFDTLASFSAAMQPVSIDEAYLDVTGIADDPMQLAGVIRESILKATKCPASIGIGPNKLVAKLATRRAKPDNGTGIFRVSLAEVRGFLAPMQVFELHGIGREKAERLHAMGIETAGQLLAHSLPLLRKEFGPFEGARLQMISQGSGQESPVQPPGKHQSISVNCNWGVRFNHRHEADAFLAELARELAGRLETDGRIGRHLTLKVMKSRDTTVEPPKFLGHGWCDIFSTSVTRNCAFGSAGQIAQEGKRLLTCLKIDPTYIRGLGLAMSNLVFMTAGMQTNATGLQPSVEDAYGAAGDGSDRQKAARRPVSERAPLVSTREYAGLSMSQVPQEVLDALGTQGVKELNDGLRQTRSRSGPAGGRLPIAKPPHHMAKVPKAAAKQTRKPAKASKPAKGSAPKPPAPMPAAAAPEPTSILCAEPCDISLMRTALRENVLQLAMIPDESDELLVHLGRLLELFCSTCVMQNDLLSVQRLLRFARSLVAETPAWKEPCESAVVASQHMVWERFHTTVQLTDSGC